MASRAELDLRTLTSEPRAAAAVGELLIAVQGELGESILAVWFDGSIALDEFDPERSDIDLVVVTPNTPTEDEIVGLRTVHARSALTAPWGDEIETVYVSLAGLRSNAVNSGVLHLYVERGSGGELVSGPVDPGWLVHLRVLREHGRSITGPAPVDIVEAVSNDELKRVALWGVERWLERYREDPNALARLGTRVFAVLTMCRLVYTLRTGQVASKIAAARWALAAVPSGLAPVIEGAMAWRKDDVASARTTPDGARALIDWLGLLARPSKESGE